jgi:pimeloyl-ACP methyl ester carboxylesterase
MNEATETRQLISLHGLGDIVRGTYHKDDGESSGAQRIAVLVLNSLSPTRAAAGDSAVYWADSFAGSGYPTFRLDMPGFGDSDGNPPPELLQFINSGGYGPIAAAMMRELSEQFGLSGVVIVGLCAGAVSALYTAAASKECRGLVLMDPYFHLPLPARSWLWQKLTGRISRTALGRLINNGYDRFTDVRLYLRRNPMPENTNFPLLRCWKTVASSGLPILLLKAPTTKPRGEEFDYLRYILEQAGSNSRVVARVVEGAGHTFSNRVGRAGVRELTESWLNLYFPLPGCDDHTNTFCRETADLSALRSGPHGKPGRSGAERTAVSTGWKRIKYGNSI